MLAVEARDIVKRFRSGWPRRRTTEALSGATLEVPRGSIHGLLGPNGAGKTTLLSILTTLLVPDAGTARVLGLDVVREGAALRGRINMASGNASFLWSLRPAEVLTFYGRLYGLGGGALRRRGGRRAGPRTRAGSPRPRRWWARRAGGCPRPAPARWR